MSRAANRLNQQLSRMFGVRLVKDSSLRAARTEPPRGRADRPRPPADPELDRLLRAPVFVLSSVRSGSTLLRMLLNAHPEICAPPETHVRRLTVGLTSGQVRQACEHAGLNRSDLEHLLWDRMLHRELVRSGKRVLVEKTPSNVFVYRRLRLCWPDARFVFLLRHPGAVVRSWHEADPVARPMAEAERHTGEYLRWLERARTELPGHELRYEDLTADPAAETRRLCDFLGVDWDPRMLHYATPEAELTKGIGDWRSAIRTGTVQPARPAPADVPASLADLARSWGYAA